MENRYLRRSIVFFLALSLALWQTPVSGIALQESSDEATQDPGSPIPPILQPELPPGSDSKDQESAPEYVPGELIVKLKEGFDLSAVVDVHHAEPQGMEPRLAEVAAVVDGVLGVGGPVAVGGEVDSHGAWHIPFASCAQNSG